MDKSAGVKTDKSAKFKVTIEYCNAWGYYGMVRTAASAIAVHYPNAVISDKRATSGSGTFDVIVTEAGGKETKEVVFSKNKGDGWMDQSNAIVMVERIKKIVEGS